MGDIDWNNVLIDASIAAMQGIQESSKLGMAMDIMPDKLAKISVNIAKCLVTELKNNIENNK